MLKIESLTHIYRGRTRALDGLDKGALIMYRLKQTVGEEVVNRSLRRLLALYAFKPAPYPSSKDFVKILREEAGPSQDHECDLCQAS